MQTRSETALTTHLVSCAADAEVDAVTLWIVSIIHRVDKPTTVPIPLVTSHV
jgi:hypothetical protein